ncbi:MAG: hypothetical protein AB7I32_17790, partial [Gammaproteobacteria bacterium]
LKMALARMIARTFVMPIDEDMFFPVRDCAAEQKLIKHSELRVLKSICGHLVVVGIDPGYLQQLDEHLKDLLAIEV